MQPLISAPQIASRVAELAVAISAKYINDSHPLTLIGVLDGSFMFLADLCRHIGIPHQIAFVTASSYRGLKTTPGCLTWDTSHLPDLAGRNVLLVDDIFDTGQTLTRLIEVLGSQRPSSVKTAVLLWKTERRAVSLCPDFVAFEIPDVFVVGYGLDYDEAYRHLPEICVLPAHHAAKA